MKYWGTGAGLSAYFAAIIWSKLWEPGRRRARREEREHTLRAAPGGLMVITMHINDATINIYDR
jgi:hypothetical protein